MRHASRDMLNNQYNIMQHFDCIPATFRLELWAAGKLLDERKYLMDWTDWLDYIHIFYWTQLEKCHAVLMAALAKEFKGF
jgi:hypothetical protein